MRRRRGRRGHNQGGGDGGRKSENGENAGSGEDNLRIRPVAYLDGYPGTAAGEPIFMISIADRDGSIETIAIDVADTKRLVIDGLIALREAPDPFAAYLIDRYFRKDSPHPHDDWGDLGS